MGNVNPGDGWMLVGFGDTIQPGDEMYVMGQWTSEHPFVDRPACSKFRRRIPPTNAPVDGWLDPHTVAPVFGQACWFVRGKITGYCQCFLGDISGWQWWIPDRTNEIPTPPPLPPPRPQHELDAEASASWYRERSDEADLLCEKALRMAFEAGIQYQRDNAK